MYEPMWKDLESKGEFTKKKYFGHFLIKPFLTHKERADAVRLTELYARGIVEDRLQRNFLMTAAFLKFHILKHENAAWWDDPDEMFGLNIEDEQPLYDLWDLVKKVQDETINPKSEDSEGTESEKNEKV